MCLRNRSDGRTSRLTSLYQRWRSHTKSIRSSMYGIQPMPPSDRAIFRFGNLWNTGDSSNSAVADMEFRPNSEIATVKFVEPPSGDTFGAPPEPKCSEIGMSVSWAAASSGSQWSVCQEGKPSRCGSSMKVNDFAPFAAVRYTSATDASTSHHGTMTSGIWRSGAYAHHSSRMKSLYACTQSFASSMSLDLEKTVPAKPPMFGKQS